jgi:redox-sensitive bicupin YhaK (pirin superfamily)
MSWQPAQDPKCAGRAEDRIETAIVPRARDLGGFEVRRALPSARRQMVGPFIFFDQMGPAMFSAGHGLDVRPHPHIGLATVTYLFEGEILHRDSLGTIQAIRPGAVNLMTAGRGIAHSERTEMALRSGGHAMFGIQSWVALPKTHEETAPAFSHHAVDELPVVEAEGMRARVVAGSLWGVRSPVPFHWDTVYADCVLEAGARLPVPAEVEDRAVYLVSGEIEIGGDVFAEPQLLVFKPGEAFHVLARTPARVVLVGGAVMDGPRHIWWNFVSSSRERIEQAKADWQAGRFEAVPGETEFIPLPEK